MTPAIAYTLADGTIAPTELPEWAQVWWGTYQGAALGLMTDRSGPIPPEGDAQVSALLRRVAALVKCLADDRVLAASGARSIDLQAASDQLVELAWQPSIVVVDGEPVPAHTVHYLGLDAVAGTVHERASFVLVRPHRDEVAQWPALATLPSPEDR